MCQEESTHAQRHANVAIRYAVNGAPQDGPLQQSLQLYSMKPPSTALTLRHAPTVEALQHYSTLQPLQPLQPSTAIQPLQYTALYTPPLEVREG